MMKNIKLKAMFIVTLLVVITPVLSLAADNKAMVVSDISGKAKVNSNWKSAFATAKHGQVVFMNITTQTNPKNEIGMETHKFDQFIFVIEGAGKAILDGKESMVKSGDMIFIPEGVQHNVINSSRNKALKVISVYSENDIPANAAYKKKTNESQD